MRSLGNGRALIECGRTGLHYTIAYVEAYDVGREEAEANAELIASAPSLAAENARLREFADSFAMQECRCEEPEPGEVGTVVCDGCRARAALAQEGGR